MTLLQAHPVGSAPQNQFLRRHRHPLRLVLRQIQHHEQPRRLRFDPKIVVVLDSQWKRRNPSRASARSVVAFSCRLRAGRRGPPAMIRTSTLSRSGSGTAVEKTRARRQGLDVRQRQPLLPVRAGEQRRRHAIAPTSLSASRTRTSPETSFGRSASRTMVRDLDSRTACSRRCSERDATTSKASTRVLGGDREEGALHRVNRQHVDRRTVRIAAHQVVHSGGVHQEEQESRREPPRWARSETVDVMTCNSIGGKK